MLNQLDGSFVTDLGDRNNITIRPGASGAGPDAAAQARPRRMARGTTPAPLSCQARSREELNERISMDRIMGLAVFGEKVAARTYALMAKLRPEHAPLLRTFATMEGIHATWFSQVCVRNGFQPDREFADKELGYLIAQVDAHFAARDFDALAVLQGFIVECLAISTYEPFIEASRKYEGMSEIFTRVLAEERYHVEWVTGYLRDRFAGRDAEFMTLVERVNSQGVECVGGTLMNITDYLTCVGLSGADCAGSMTDEYLKLLELVGIDPRRATKNVVSLFVPIIRKYRQGLQTK